MTEGQVEVMKIVGLGSILGSCVRVYESTESVRDRWFLQHRINPVVAAWRIATLRGPKAAPYLAAPDFPLPIILPPRQPLTSTPENGTDK